MDNNRIKEALEYATKMHQGQLRKDGTDYINHPIRVANYVKKFKQSKNLENLIISAYLHDTLEDTEATYYELVEKFGPQVASIVLELTTDIDFKKELGKTKYLEIKMKNMSSWALVIKLCDRLDNVSDLINADETFKDKYIKETLEIISYLINNRQLSNTQITIIKDILKALSNVENNELINEINKIKEKVKTD